MPPRQDSKNRLVYSTETGAIAPPRQDASRPKHNKKNRGPATPDTPKDGIVRVSRSTKGRRGKGVTLITGVPLTGDDLKEFARQLKQKCGSGGALKGDIIEIQGDHRDVLVAVLTERGYTVKRAGG